MRDLGTLGGSSSTGFGINNRGDVTGWSYAAGGTDSVAFVYFDGVMLDLNQLVDQTSATGWKLLSGRDINDAGQITGYGILNGESRAFLLTPSPVPEPRSFSLILLGIGILILRKRSATAK